MSPIELALRAAAVAQLLALVLNFLRQRQDNTLYLPLALLLLGIMGYTLAPITVDHGLRTVWSYPFVTLASAIPLLFWYFSCHIFRDGFALQHWMIALGAFSVLISLLAFCDYADANRCSGNAQRVTYYAATAGKFFWTLAAFIVVAKDWRNDLVEQRRSLRRALVLAVGCYILVVLVVEIFVPEETPLALEVLNMLLVLAALTAFSVYVLSPRKDNVFTALVPEQQPHASHRADSASALATRLMEVMSKERAYAREDLSIDGLASDLATTSHQLRKVINGELGYRNFNTFINGYRVDEVAQRMKSTEFARTPVLTLALDAGFRSMAPFNRAFKEKFKVTPSEYRSENSH